MEHFFATDNWHVITTVPPHSHPKPTGSIVGPSLLAPSPSPKKKTNLPSICLHLFFIVSLLYHLSHVSRFSSMALLSKSENKNPIKLTGRGKPHKERKKSCLIWEQWRLSAQPPSFGVSGGNVRRSQKATMHLSSFSCTAKTLTSPAGCSGPCRVPERNTLLRCILGIPSNAWRDLKCA